MGKKLDRVYDALLNGAVKGLAGTQLYEYVLKKCPKTPTKRVVKASLFALSDPDVQDRNILQVIYALAIDYRLADLGVNETPEEDDDAPGAPAISQKLKERLESTTAIVPIADVTTA
ncbi:hypothetical protein [Pararhizobium sp. PWRC1-1]|uniref:hypothetical protein n=1 Tax=Pararhizobium sp. PWRC1-1 TaxID=2804566 RepID=UPI003CF2DC67